MHYRLKSIEVEVSGTTARAYEIKYQESADTGRSVVDSIQQFGRDAVVATDGSVISGPSLPAMLMDYPTEAPAGAFPYSGSAGTYQPLNCDYFAGECAYFDDVEPPGGHLFADNPQLFGVADFNGDGRVDVFGVYDLQAPIFWVGMAAGDSNDPTYEMGTFEINNQNCELVWNPLFATDLNADGLADLWTACIDGGHLKIEAWIASQDANGHNFTSGMTVPDVLSTTEGTGWSWFSPSAPVHLFPGDVNSDGLTDIIAVYRKKATDIRIRVGYAQGDGTFGDWEESSYSTLSWPSNTKDPWIPGDFNNDGYADIVAVFDDNGTLGLQYAIRDPSSGTFTVGSTLTPWPSQAWADWTAQIFPGDANGDGILDIMMAWDEGGYVSLNSAISRDLTPGSPTPFDFESHLTNISWSGVESYGRVFAGDINADGTDEFHVYYEFDPTTTIPKRFDLTTFFRRPNGSYDARTTAPLIEYITDGETYQYDDQYPYARDVFAVVDQDGDGLRDIVQISGTDWVDIGWYYRFMNFVPRLSNAEPDLVDFVANGIGGTSDITYAPSSAWPNPQYLPQGMVIQTVESIVTADGRTQGGASGRIDYTYEGALYSPSERRFLGFRRVTHVVDGTGATNETIYHQHEGCIPKPESIAVLDGSGGIVVQSEFDYAPDADGLPPFTSVVTDQWNHECNGATTLANCRTTLTQFAYDIYGNVTHLYEHGIYTGLGDDLGDERTTVRTYDSPNPDAYIVALPSSSIVYDGIGETGPMVKKKVDYYDLNGNKTVERVNFATFGSNWAITNWTYDGFGNALTVTDPVDRTTTFTYDSTYNIFPETRCNALSHCTARLWDGVIGRMTQWTDANSQITTFDHDAFARLEEVDPPGPALTTYEYRDYGNPDLQRIKRTDADGSADGLWSEVYRDGLGREYRTKFEGGVVVDTQYNGTLTRVWKESLAYRLGSETPRFTTYEYDAASRIRKIIRPGGAAEVEIQYFATSTESVRAVYNELDQLRQTWTDGLGRTVQVEENDLTSHHTTYSYDAAGRVIQSVDDSANVSTYAYNLAGFKTQACVSGMGCWSYQYTKSGQLRKSVDGLNHQILYYYDEIGRLEKKTTWYPITVLGEWFYDEAGYGFSTGRLTRVVYPEGSEYYSYDERGRVTDSALCVSADCRIFGATYDELDRVKSITYPDDEIVNYTYDDEGFPETVSGNVVNYVTDMDWSSSGRLTSIDYGNGATADYDYDPDRDWLDVATILDETGATLYDANYNVDVAARIEDVNITRPGGTELWDYGYDALSRLTSVSVGGGPQETYQYDAIGNIESKGALGTYQYDDPINQPHAVSRVGDTGYVYDLNGSLTEKRDCEDPTCSTYTTLASYNFNLDNQLEQYSDGNGSTSYDYTPGGQRIQSSGPQGTRRFFGDLVESKDGIDVYFYFAGSMRVAMKVKDTPEVRYWYHHDHLGSVRVMTDESGLEVAEYDFMPFGEPEGVPSGPVENPYDFAGHRTDPESGLVYMNARYYDPEIGRFISADRIVADAMNPQSLNKYSYGHNNPISNVDPTGNAVEGGSLGIIAFAIIMILGREDPAGIFGAPNGGENTWNRVLDTSVGRVPSAVGGVMLGFQAGYETDFAQGLLGTGASVTSDASPVGSIAVNSVGWGWEQAGHIRAAEDGVSAAAGAQIDRADEVSKGLGNRAGVSQDGGRFNVPGEGGLFGGAIGAPTPPDVRTQSVEDLNAEYKFLENEVLVGAEEKLNEQLREAERLNQLPFLRRLRELPRRLRVNARIQELAFGVDRNNRIFGRQTEILRELNRRGETLGMPRRRLIPDP